MGNVLSIFGESNELHARDIQSINYSHNKLLKSIQWYLKYEFVSDVVDPVTCVMFECTVRHDVNNVSWENLVEDIIQSSIFHDPDSRCYKNVFWIRFKYLNGMTTDEMKKKIELDRTQLKTRFDYLEEATKGMHNKFSMFISLDKNYSDFSICFTWRKNELARALVKHCNTYISTNMHLDLNDYFGDKKEMSSTSDSSSDSSSEEELH